jgi:hypothetical protein
MMMKSFYFRISRGARHIVDVRMFATSEHEASKFVTHFVENFQGLDLESTVVGPWVEPVQISVDLYEGDATGVLNAYFLSYMTHTVSALYDLHILRVSVARVAQVLDVDTPKLNVKGAEYSSLWEKAEKIDRGWNDLLGRCVERGQDLVEENKNLNLWVEELRLELNRRP